MVVNIPKLGSTQERILKIALQEGVFRAQTEGEMKASRTFNSRGHLGRDKQDGTIWYPTEKAKTDYPELAPVPAGTPLEAPLADGRYQLLPALSAQDYEALEKSIVENGVLVPVEYDEVGEILDGHHRVAICRKLGLKDWPKLVRTGMNEERKRTYARELNLSRRHMNTEQKRSVIEQQLRDTPSLSARAIAARLGVDHKTITAAKVRLTDGGEIPHQSSVIGRDGVRQPAQKPIKTAFVPIPADVPEYMRGAKILRREKAEKKHGVRLMHMSFVASNGRASAGQIDQLFPVIYADPPWQFGVHSEVTGRDKSPENHYPTMPTDDICGLFEKIGAPAKAGSVLFLWATNPMLPDALRVMDAWGFAYVHHWIWDKEIAGTGYWGRDRHELLLIGRRGDVAAPLPGSQPETVHREAKRRHSQKPDFFAETIERLYPAMPRLEMFCRDPRPGWTAWGFESAQQAEAAE